MMHRGLLPHVFTLVPIKPGRLFSVALAVHSSVSRNVLPVRKYGALCCPDFPRPDLPDAAEQAAGRCKDTTNTGIILFSTFAGLEREI